MSRLFGCVRTNNESVHVLPQERICEMGEQLGYRSITEYEVPDLVTEGRVSRIDVVWLSENTVVAAFEIRRKSGNLDMVTTRKDTKKLWFLAAQERFIVNISQVSGKAYFHKLADVGLV